MHSTSFRRRLGFASVAVVTAFCVSAPTHPQAHAYLTLHGGPTFDGTNGYSDPTFHHDEASFFPQASWQLLNDAGTAAWISSTPPSSHRVALRFTPSSGPAIQLGDLAGPPTSLHSAPWAINAGGTIVGTSRDGNSRNTPVRWHATGTAPTELPTLTTTMLGPTEGKANDINDDEYAVGWSGRFHPTFLVNLGDRAVRWDAAGNIMELGNISTLSFNCGTGTCFVATAEAYAINNSEVAVGRAHVYPDNAYDGDRAVRWDAAGTATQLGHLGTENSPNSADTLSAAWAVNESGDAVGYARKYDGSGNFKGHRAVRWNHNTTAALELEVLGGTDPSGVSESKVFTLNDAGTAVGWSNKHIAGVNQGARAVRWNAAGQATQLEGLNGADDFAHAIDINNSGIAVGILGNGPIPTAAYWDVDGNSVALNTLIDPNLGWELTHALAISDTGWITGLGKFDPDGVGGQFKYTRVFMLQLPVLPGDYNDDGTVDAADNVVWRKLNNTAATLPNDNTPGVDSGDQIVWQENFGESLPQGAGGHAQVPEPAALAVFALLLLPLAMRRQCATSRP